jgi:hypothetical protein
MMEKHAAVTLETVLELTKKLNAVERLKLAERVLVELEPIVAGKEPTQQKLSRSTPKGHTRPAEESREIDWKLWGNAGRERPQHIVQLEGLWENVPFDVSPEDVRQMRGELSAALQRRTERL